VRNYTRELALPKGEALNTLAWDGAESGALATGSYLVPPFA